MTARDLFFGKRKYFYQIPGNRFVYKISVIREVRQPVKFAELPVLEPISGFLVKFQKRETMSKEK